MTGANRYSAIRPKSGIDRKSVCIFVALMLIGWVNVFAATCKPPIGSFELGSEYGKQAIWVVLSLFTGMLILLSSEKYYHIYAYPAYAITLVFLIATLFIGREVNGAKSWLVLGPVSLQTAEFMKLGACLAVARYMSEYNFSLNKIKNIAVLAALILLPIGIIVMQNDTGSALVFCSFMFMLYREGVNGWIYIILISAVGLFVCSFWLQPAVLLALLLILCTISAGLIYGIWRECARYLAGVLLLTVLIFFGTLLFSIGFPVDSALLVASAVSLVWVAVFAYRHKMGRLHLTGLTYVGLVVYMQLIDYAFNNLLKAHQQERILDLLLNNTGYNVRQSKIAIGSGGVLGKGFLQGTQTNYGFVPAQNTDFIFCTVGEEFGLWGSLIVVGLFGWLIVRLISMGERQKESFSRIYCYCVAGILLFHVLINIGMVLGLLPVIGIPLPLFSYGGSSLLVFSIMFFIAVKLDSAGREEV